MRDLYINKMVREISARCPFVKAKLENPDTELEGLKLCWEYLHAMILRSLEPPPLTMHKILRQRPEKPGMVGPVDPHKLAAFIEVNRVPISHTWVDIRDNKLPKEIPV